MTLPLSKTLDPADYASLQKELALIDVFFHSDAQQHEHRRWEYALALDAVERWERDRDAHVAVDVGGAGSPWHRILGQYLGLTVPVVDPAHTGHTTSSTTLERYVSRNPPLADVVTCLSVLEHVEDLDRFLYHLACLTAPGGLLFLTVDCCGCEEAGAWRLHHVLPGDEDQHHFHWMRKRMFTRSSWEYLHLNLRPSGFELLGDVDWTYHGNHVHDYSFASLALRRRP